MNALPKPLAPLALILGLLAAPLAFAQTSPPPRVAAPIRFGEIPDSVSFDVTREGFFSLGVIGPVGVQITIKSVENETIGGQPARSLFSLVEPAVVAVSGTTTNRLQPSAAVTKLVTQQPPNGSIGGSDQKRLRFAGVPGASTVPKVVTVELEAAGGGARAVTKTVRVVLGPDSGLPVIKTVGASSSDQDTFPPFLGTPANNNGWNIVQTTMQVQIDADNFTVPAVPNVEFLALYRVIAEYDDGARFSVSIRPDTQATNIAAGATRTVAMVPNIGRGGFRILLETPAGTVRDTRQFTFPANVFTSHGSTFCPVTIIGVDVAASKPSENNFWAPVVFNTPALPATRQCGVTYGKWRDVDIEETTMSPAGVASSKFTRRPAQGSIASNSNMPTFSCSAAGLGTASIEWRAKLDIFVGECPDRQVQ